MAMDDFDYPKVKHSLARTALEDPYPALYLDTRGVIQGANLMAFWLWNELLLSEPLRLSALLGRSIFSVYPHNFQRISIELNGEFYTKKSSMVKRMKAGASLESFIYEPFILAMKSNPQLEKIYEQAPYYSDYEWENPLNIMPPGQTDGSHLLEFRVTIYRLEGDSGFLCMYTPTGSTLRDAEEQYGLLINVYGDNAYVQLDKLRQPTGEGNQLLPGQGTSFRAYYPMLAQDPLWNIIWENKAHQLLVGNPVVGAHFFELFFAPQLREWMGPIQETSAPRALKYFTTFTSPFLDENHELHAKYEGTMARLQQLQDFRYALEVSRKLPIRLLIPDNSDAPFYTCRVILPWAVTPQISLQFRSMVQLLPRNRMVQSDIRDYLVTLVPENFETEVALILLHVQSISKDGYKDNDGVPLFMQFVWLLSVMRTVKEGISGGDEEDTSWEPVSAFARIYDRMVIEFNEHASNKIDIMVAEFRESIAELGRENIVNKVSGLDMLYNLTNTISSMDQLSNFLMLELENAKSNETMRE
jgi:hypothetical protein